MLLNFTPTINTTGGAEKIFCQMANFFVKNNIDVVAVCFDDKIGKPFYELDSKVMFVNCGLYIKNDRPFLYKVKRSIIINKNKRHDYDDIVLNRIKMKRILPIIRQEKPDLIISYCVEATYFLFQYCNVEIPVITMLHGNPKAIMAGQDDKRVSALLKSTYVQVLTPGFVDYMTKRYGTGNYIYIPNPVSQIDIECISERQNVIINVARFDENKNQLLLIEAFSRLPICYSEWKLNLWGSREFDQEYYNLCYNKAMELKLLDRINFCGVTEDIQTELLKAKIFAFPSKSEGFPLALAEAMSAGITPVVLRNCAGCNELVIDGCNGLLCDNYANDLSEKLRFLIEYEDKRVLMGKEAHEDMKRFRAESVWDMWLNICLKYCNDD